MALRKPLHFSPSAYKVILKALGLKHAHDIKWIMESEIQIVTTVKEIKGNRHLPVFTFDFSGPHPHRVNAAQFLCVCVWSLCDTRLVWAFGIENRQATTVLPCLQAAFEGQRMFISCDQSLLISTRSNANCQLWL